MAKCYRCETELELLPEEYEGENEEVRRDICPYCGIIYDTLLPDPEERQEFHFFNEDAECTISDENHGYEGKCPNCGHYVIIMSNFMRSEVYGDVDEDDVDEYGLPKDDTIVDCVYCPNCGANITVVPPKPSEEANYPYFQEQSEEN